MKIGTTMVLAVAGMVLTACGGPITPEEAAPQQTEVFAQSAAELGSCANWSEWNNTGHSYCGSSNTCGYYWSCDYYLGGNGTGAKTYKRDAEGNMMPMCEDGSPPVRIYYDAYYNEQYRYRVCFDEYGNYTHTEYEYQNAKSSCGC